MEERYPLNGLFLGFFVLCEVYRQHLFTEVPRIGILRTSRLRSSRELDGTGLSEVQMQTIGTESCGASLLAVVHLRGTRKLGFVLMKAPPGMKGRFFVAVEP